MVEVASHSIKTHCISSGMEVVLWREDVYCSSHACFSVRYRCWVVGGKVWRVDVLMTRMDMGAGVTGWGGGVDALVNDSGGGFEGW